MNTPITITATQAARGLSEILNQVYYQGKSFEIKKGKQVVAVISAPKKPIRKPAKKTITTGELETFFKSLPKLDEKDRREMWDVVQKIRKEKPQAIDWD